MSDRIVSREEFISAVGVNGNPVQMAQRSALLINHDRALRSALADAERERDDLRQIHKDEMDLHDEMERRLYDKCEAQIAALRAERDALRADLRALVPLARWALNFNDSQDWPEDIAIEQTAAARAILARVATEGAL